MWCDPFFEILVLMIVFVFDMFAKKIPSDYLISAIFKFLMKSLFTGGVGSLSKLFL